MWTWLGIVAKVVEVMSGDGHMGGVGIVLGVGRMIDGVCEDTEVSLWCSSDDMDSALEVPESESVSHFILSGILGLFCVWVG